MNGLEQTSSRGLRERYAILLDVGRILTGTLQRDDLYRAIFEQAGRVLEVDSFYIALYDEVADTASVVFHAHGGREHGVAIAYRGSHSFAIREGRPGFHSAYDPDFAILAVALGGLDRAATAICAPIIADGKVIGVLGAQAPAGTSYDHRDLEILNSIAAVAGVALGSAEYIQDTERRRQEAERLEALGRALTASLEPEAVLRRSVEAAIDLIACDGAAVLLLEPAGLRLAGVGGAVPLRKDQIVTLPPRLRSRLVETRETLVVENIGHHPLLPSGLREQLEAGSAAAVPLVAGDHVIGVLAIGDKKPRAYAADELRLLERLSFHVAIAVENARLHEQIRALSLTDPLTGLSNRRHMELVLEKEFAAARRGRKLAVVLFDLDHFKAYNDTAGHQAGDEALRAFAAILAGETRAFDLAARYGGDEFLCVLSDSGLDGALAMTARVERAIRANPMLHAIGVTAGHAIFDRAMTEPAELIRAADRELYERKAQRR